MIFVLLGTPSSGGPRCLRGRSVLPSLASAPASPLAASLVEAVNGRTPVAPSVASPLSSPSFLPLRPPRAERPPRPRPRPRPRVEERRRCWPSPPSTFSASPVAAGSGLRASWTETLRSRMLLPFKSLMARSASEGVETSTKAYPTGRVVRGLVGIDVVSLSSHVSCAFFPSHANRVPTYTR